MKKLLTLLFILSYFISSYAQIPFTTTITYEQDEYWWGGVVAFGSQMPYIKPIKEFDLSSQSYNNQVIPLFLSNKGRYLWSDKPFHFQIEDNSIIIKSEFEDIKVQQAGNTLKEAYLAASQKYFPPSNSLPDAMFFISPQYNTWIELMYNQNQEDVIKYAQNIIKNNFPKGILMIDDNWQKYYGNFDFKPDKFTNPKQMVDKLHQMGFAVMLWVCPFVTADSPEYRELSKQGYLIKQKGTNTPAIISWWNGQSACYDFTNPDAKKHYINQLKQLQIQYGIDGFKFDAGDNVFYNPIKIDSYQKDAISTDHVMAWQEIGAQFKFNEFRAGWKMGGQPLVERLGDKDYSWSALQTLIPEMLAAGLMGYPYTCPDMIGGGQYSTFIGINDNEFNQELIIRSAQIHALMPMMQFSVAPWRVLNKENLEITRKMAHLHEQFGPYILQCAIKSAETGEPIIQHMEYAYPYQGFANCKDQFMLGDKYLVAPIITSINSRVVKFPKGKWRDSSGKVYKGGQSVSFQVPLSQLLYFENIK